MRFRTILFDSIFSETTLCKCMKNLYRDASYYLDKFCSSVYFHIFAYHNSRSFSHYFALKNSFVLHRLVFLLICPPIIKLRESFTISFTSILYARFEGKFVLGFDL